MEIMNDYELRRCGSQVVFRRFAEPSGQFETVFVADEVVKIDIPGLTVLKKGFGTYALLREKGVSCYKKECVEYRLEKGRVLYRIDKWYWWRDDFQAVPLGTALDKEGFLFLDKKASGTSLNFFSDNELTQLGVKTVDPKHQGMKEAGCLIADVCRVLTEDGWRYVSIVTKGEEYYVGGLFRGYQQKGKVIVSEKPYAPIADYYHFVKKFVSSKPGFGWVADFDEKFAAALWEGKEPFCYVTLLPSFNNCGESFGVKVLARTRQIFEGETQNLYLVLAKDVYYKQDADEVEMGMFNGKPCLYVRHAGKVHKFVYQPKIIGAKLQLLE